MPHAKGSALPIKTGDGTARLLRSFAPSREALCSNRWLRQDTEAWRNAGDCEPQMNTDEPNGVAHHSPGSRRRSAPWETSPGDSHPEGVAHSNAPCRTPSGNAVKDSRKAFPKVLPPLPHHRRCFRGGLHCGGEGRGGLMKRGFHRGGVCSPERPVWQGQLAPRSNAGEPGGVSPRTGASGERVRRLTPSGSPDRRAVGATDSARPPQSKPPRFRSFHQAKAGVRGLERARWPPHPHPLPRNTHRAKDTSIAGERGPETWWPPCERDP